LQARRTRRGAAPAPRAALAEGFERAEPLDGVQQLGAEAAVRAIAREAARGLAAVPYHGRDQREERGRQEDQGNAQIEERDRGEDERRREESHEELREILAEVHLELLHRLDQGQRDVAGATLSDVRGAERDHVAVE